MLSFHESGSGPAVVLIHAFPMDSALWTAQREALAEAGYRVITPDLPGFGATALADADPALDVMADAVVELLDHLGLETAIVGGLSMGGYVTMNLARRHPGRLSAIILADTKPGADPAEAAANRLAVATAVEAAGTAAGVADAMMPNLLGVTTRETRPAVVATVREWIVAQDPAGVAWAQRAMAARPDSLAVIGAFGRPVLVLFGAEDAISPAPDAQAMAQAAHAGGSPTALVEIAGVGHLSAVEDPDAVSGALIDWLATLH